jgi:transcriptional regulator with XRE-family HTH domain
MNDLTVSFKLTSAIGVRLRELREAKALSRTGLAKRLTLSDAQLGQIEENETSLFYSESIRIAAARKVADFLGEPLIFQVEVQTSSMAKDLAIETSSVAESINAPAEPDIASGNTIDFAEGIDKPLHDASEQTEAEQHSQTAHKTDASSPEIPRGLWRFFSIDHWPVRPGVLLVLLVLVALVVMVDITLWLVGDGKTLPVRPALQSPAQQAPAISQPTTPSVESQSPPWALAPGAVAQRENTFPGAGAKTAQADELACDRFQGPVFTFTPGKATKEASLVYVVGTPGQWVCLKDGRSQAWRHVFASPSGQSFYGRPPWLVESPHLGSMQIYFQGVLVKSSQAESGRLRLNASEVF